MTLLNNTGKKYPHLPDDHLLNTDYAKSIDYGAALLDTEGINPNVGDTDVPKPIIRFSDYPNGFSAKWLDENTVAVTDFATRKITYVPAEMPCTIENDVDAKEIDPRKPAVTSEERPSLSDNDVVDRKYAVDLSKIKAGDKIQIGYFDEYYEVEEFEEMLWITFNEVQYPISLFNILNHKPAKTYKTVKLTDEEKQDIESQTLIQCDPEAIQVNMTPQEYAKYRLNKGFNPETLTFDGIKIKEGDSVEIGGQYTTPVMREASSRLLVIINGETVALAWFNITAHYPKRSELEKAKAKVDELELQIAEYGMTELFDEAMHAHKKLEELESKDD